MSATEVTSQQRCRLSVAMTSVLPLRRRRSTAQTESAEGASIREGAIERRWQFDGGKNRGGSTSVRGRVRSPHISGGGRWLSCSQTACLLPRQLRHGTDRRTDKRTDGSRYRLMPPPLGRGHNKGSAPLTGVCKTASRHNHRWTSLHQCVLATYTL